MKAMLVTYVNSTNIGDQLIANSFEKLLKEKMEVVKYDYSLKNIGPNYDIDKSRVKKQVSSFNKFYKKYLRERFLIDSVHRVVNSQKVKRNPDWEKYKSELEECDILIIGGGNAIFDTTPQSRSAYFFNLHIELAKELGKKVFVISVGIGPFITEKQIEHTRKTLQKCEYVTFRDEKSLSYMMGDNFQSEKMKLSIDPVFVLEHKFESTNQNNKIGICIIDYRLTRATVEEYLKYKNDLIKLIIEISNTTELAIELFSTEIVDYQTVYEIYKEFEDNDKVRVKEIYDFDDLIELYSNLDLVIGTRMHSMIISASQYVPIIGLSWQQKVDQMFSVLGDLESVFPIDNIGENQREIIEKLQYKRENFLAEKQKLIEFKKEAILKYDINKEILNKII